jgi:hypothetical protein
MEMIRCWDDYAFRRAVGRGYLDVVEQLYDWADEDGKGSMRDIQKIRSGCRF